ncbi:hypothetical protein GFJ94_10765 [Flavobacterium sp. LMO8]|uniref:hypothetical protein n=1 Tax=Flavobacterium sp. LMO8 TaxID=2654244 RepID=UPI00129154AC|nr:hypothetical protein [Flavobacterium sp. LMO8]MQP25546.1 hypothetical protein [Flavobacterium sp. LMO8]
MKKLILVALLVVSSLTFAQERGRKGEKLTPEQQTELQVKKMTLELDLDAKQQKEIKAILLENAKKREAKMTEMKAKREKGKKPSADEKFAMKNEILDHQIEHKAQMKKILKPEQYQKWEDLQKNKIKKGKIKMQKKHKK